MAQNYGLGRGLASLIPQKKKTNNESASSSKTISEPKENFNYFGNTSNPDKKQALSEKSDIAAKPVIITPKNFPNLSKSTDSNQTLNEIDISLIVPNPHQPRIRFDEEKMKELAASIKEHGIIQPIIVSKNNGGYEIIAGERRFEAAKLAGLKKVPIVLRDVTAQQKLELAIIENIQRHDLNPIEEAKAYKKLMDDFDIDQEEVATKVGKSRSAVANKLRLLNLPFDIQIGLIGEKITEGHAKAILAITDPEKQRALYDLIVKNNLTVRQTENKTKEVTVKTHKRSVVDPQIKQIEDDLSSKLGTKVKVQKSGGGGRIVIEYYSQEELDGILEKMK
ncbi:MAG TPA: ParB/RepB/Spo0J family partition protein [Patescibacteria group bacterium]|nr:ParB/RepB/Spo0J family partition protein [Patescibacteria group bacterium]